MNHYPITMNPWSNAQAPPGTTASAPGSGPRLSAPSAPPQAEVSPETTEDSRTKNGRFTMEQMVVYGDLTIENDGLSMENHG